MNATSYRTLTALFAVLPLCAAGLANLPPEPQGYRMEDYRAPTPATLRGALVLSPIIDTWVLQGWYKSLISLSGHGDFAEYVVPRADDIVC
jgi:hypothetical protein